jgi:cbb3-type cytochrome oxidase maturation protein
MSAIYVLIGVSIPIAAAFLIAFLWSAKSAQYDDDYTPSLRMLMDDEVKQDKTDNQNEKS